MAFIVEDGTGLPDATSYTSVEYADEYFGDQLVEGWTDMEPTANATVEERKQAYLIRATLYLDKHYRYRGTRASPEQSLQWPRVDVDVDELIDTSDVPIEIQMAACELALIAKDTPLHRTPDLNANRIKKITNRVGSISESIEYAGYGDLQDTALYPQVDGLVQPFLADQIRSDLPGAITSGVNLSDINRVLRDSTMERAAFVNGTWDNPPFSRRNLTW